MSSYRKICLVLAALFMAPVVYSVTALEQQIIDRIKPIGEVCIEGQDCGVAVAAAGTGGGAPRSGEDIYNRACFACHATGLAGAPAFGNATAWEAALAKGFDTMLANSMTGINAMPPKGTCMDCSEDEMRSAIQYMLDSLQ